MQSRDRQLVSADRPLLYQLGLWTVLSGAVLAWHLGGGVRAVRPTAPPGEITAMEVAALGTVWILGVVGLLAVARRRARRRRERDALLASVQASEERLRAAFDAVGDGVWDWDAVTNKVYFSPRWKTMLGFEPHELGDGLDEWESRVHPDDHPRVMGEVQRHFAGETALYESEHRLRCKDGRYKWILDRGQVVSRSAAGAPLRMVGTHKDLSEHRQAADALRESEQRYRHLLASVTDYVFTVPRVDGRAGPTLHSPGCLAVTGYAVEDYAANPRLWIEMVPLEEQDAVVRRAEAAWRGELLPPLEHRLQHRDGSLRWVQSTLVPRCDRDGLIVACDGLVQDITARKRLEGELRESEARHRLIADNTGDVIWLFDLARSRFSYVSPSVLKLRGYTVDEVMRQGLQDSVVPELVAAVKANLAARVAALAAGDESARTQTHELLQPCKDGSTVNTEVVTTLIADAGGRVTHLQGVTRNITVRKQAEAELVRVSRWLEHTQRLSQVGGWTVDLRTGVLWCSAEARRIYGVADGAFTVADARAARVPRFHALVDGAMKNLVEHGQPYDIEFQIVRGTDGAIRDIHSIAELDRASGLVIGVVQDITERNRADEARREDEERFRLIVQSAGAGYFRIDREGRFESVNAAWLQLHGLANADEIVGRHFSATQAPADLPAATEIVATLLAGREVPPGRFSRRLADGSLGYHTYSLHPLRRDGEVVGLEGFLIDITPLRRAESDFRMLFETMLDGFAVHEIICDAAGAPVDYRYLAANPAFERLTGLKTADIIGRTVLEIMPATERFWIETYGRVALTGEPTSFEHFSEALGRHFEVSAFRPAARQFACVFVDVTARRQAEFELRKLSRAVEQSPVSIVITDPTGAIEYVNPKFVAVTGYPLAEISGRNPRFLKSGELPAEHYRELWATITAGREWQGELHNRRKNGELFWEQASISPIFDDTGRITHFIGFKDDITARRAADDRMREQAALLDVTQDAIMVVTLDRTITFWNRGAERLYGWSAGEAVGRSFLALVYRQLPADFEAVDRLLLVEGGWSGERSHRTKSGREVTVQLRTTLVRDAGGQPKNLLLVATDLTEARQLETRFMRAQRLENLGALASGVAHDLNNVLTPVLMGIDLLRPLARTPEDRSTLQMVGEAARRGADIVGQLLLFGRGSDAPKQNLEIRRVIRDVGRIMTETFPRNLAITVKAPANLWLIMGDLTQIQQVLLNLCVNARDAMPDGGDLTVVAENLVLDEAFVQPFPGARPGPHVLVQVSDTGCGISPENLVKVFDPFFTTKPVGQGTGLGLPTVLGIVKGHGGFIDLRSRPGVGTEFMVYLPAVTTDAVVRRVEVQQAAVQGRGELILVVDDELPVRRLLQQTLTRLNYRVLVAADGAEGVAVFAGHAAEIKAVVTDLMMPVMDGVQMIRALRRVAPGIPVVGASGLHGHGAELEREGFRRLRLLPKPFVVEKLLAALRELLDEAATPPPAAKG